MGRGEHSPVARSPPCHRTNLKHTKRTTLSRVFKLNVILCTVFLKVYWWKLQYVVVLWSPDKIKNVSFYISYIVPSKRSLKNLHANSTRRHHQCYKYKLSQSNVQTNKVQCFSFTFVPHLSPAWEANISTIVTKQRCPVKHSTWSKSCRL